MGFESIKTLQAQIHVNIIQNHPPPKGFSLFCSKFKFGTTSSGFIGKMGAIYSKQAKTWAQSVTDRQTTDNFSML